MPMLHGCGYAGCETLTLSTYCLQHEQVIRAQIETERARATACDEPTTRETVATADSSIA
jgi:hypothetical protein